MAEEKSDSELDCRGLYCPEPIFRTREEINKLESGQILKVIADDPAAGPDLERWAKNTGNELIELRKEGYDFIALIKKK
ncbi:MAG: sulfurtransferase TusA family protein [Candidatus Sifarchaeia archaeon]